MRVLGRDQKGVAAFEFLLVLPFFVGFFLLAVDFGMLMYQYVSVANAVREGARYAAVNCGDGSCTDVDVKNRTIARSSGILTPLNTAQVTVRWLDNDVPVNINHDRGDSVVVSVNHPYNFMFFPATFPVVSCADMSLEQTDGGAGPWPAVGGPC
jgi:Flp pilus assembly protein TadG